MLSFFSCFPTFTWSSLLKRFAFITFNFLTKNFLNPGKKDKVDAQQSIFIAILKLPNGIKIRPATSINNGSNKIDSTDFSVDNSVRKVLNLDTKCHIPPGRYLYMFVAKNIFIILRLVGVQPILFIKNFHAYALIIILKKLN